MSISIIYCTGRKDPKAEWTINSLRREIQNHPEVGRPQFIAIDFWMWPNPEENWRENDVQNRKELYTPLQDVCDVTISPPCGNPWQGPYRLTKVNCYAKAQYLNSGVMLAKHDWLALVDDLAWIKPGWLHAVLDARDKGVVMCGSYQKVLKMVVEGSEMVSFEEFENGKDSRRHVAQFGKPVPCGGELMYGCSVALPTEAVLKVNGWPTYSDCCGYDDCITGKMIAKHGYHFVYDPRAKTYESEEHHHIGKQMHREDPCKCHPCTNPRDDKSHALLGNWAGAKFFENYYGEEKLRGIRQRVLNGDPLPCFGIPEHDWFSGVPLKDLPLEARTIDTRGA